MKRLPERKLITWATTLVFLVGGMVCCGIWPALVAIYQTYCTSVVTLTTTYFIGNVASKAVTKPGGTDAGS